VRVEDEASCTAALEELAPAYQAHETATMLSLHCARRDLGDGYDIVAVSAGERRIKDSPSVETFADHAACEADRRWLTAYYRDTLRRPVVASSCGLRGTFEMAWHVIMFEAL